MFGYYSTEPYRPCGKNYTMTNQPAQIEEILKRLKTDEGMVPSAHFRTNARIRILNAVTNRPTASSRPIVHPMRSHFALRFAFFVLVLVGGTVYAAQESSPKDILFPVKVLSERVALALSPTEPIKTSVAATIINRRAEENEHAKREGDAEEIQETITNFESAVTTIRKTEHIDQEAVEEEINKHSELFSETDGNDQEDSHENDSSEVQGAQAEQESTPSTRQATPNPTKIDEQSGGEHLSTSPEPTGQESPDQNDAEHDTEDDSKNSD